jgi:RNA polymerase sigma-70 factor (ECF subfamily)
MLEIAIPAHIPHARRGFVPARWGWSLVRWLMAVGEDGVLQSSRVQMKTRQEHTAAGEPDPAQVVDILFQEHARAVLAYLIHRLPTLADAEDVLDDVFLAALHASASGQLLTGGWLMVTAQRRIADFYRKQRRAVPLAGTDATDERHASESSEPEWVALRGEEHRKLLRLVARLPQDQQEVLALRFAAGLQSPEIGEVVGKRADAVRALLTRAMRRLREEWTQR